MPTRIPLKQASNTPHGSRRHGPASETSSCSHGALTPPASPNPLKQQYQTPSSISPSKSIGRRSSVYHRSSILRERIAERQKSRDELDEPHDEEEEQNVRLSSNDIRASPRVLGYLFSSITAAVMFVSVVQFYRTQESIDLKQSILNPSSKHKYVVIESSTDFIYRYKLLGAFFLSGIGCVLSLATTLVHFDTVLFPKLWNRVFRDGSWYEGAWIVFFVFFWAVNIHVCTSSFSVGQVQANVFFTAWLAFISSVSCLETWRESANNLAMTRSSRGTVPSRTAVSHGERRFRLLGRFLDRPHHRETTSNWVWTGICSAVFAGAVSDMYYNRSALKLLYQGAKLTIDDHTWVIILASVWAEVALCFVSVFLNEWLYKPYRLPCRCRRKNQVYRCVYGWRQIEGLLLTLTLGGKFYVILVYTGVDGPINGLSNAYFGLWFSFFNGSFLLGTWMRENKKIAFIIREDDHDDDEEDEDAAMNAAFDYDYN